MEKTIKMDLKIEDIINKRHSVRNYQGGMSLGSSFVDSFLQQARNAPTAGGIRAYEVFPVNEKSGIEKIAKIARQSWIAQASLVVILCTWPEKSAKRYGDRGRNLYCIQDTTLYGLYLDLMFVDSGYGTCWVGAFKEQELREYLKIPDHLNPISLLVVGKENA